MSGESEAINTKVPSGNIGNHQLPARIIHPTNEDRIQGGRQFIPYQYQPPYNNFNQMIPPVKPPTKKRLAILDPETNEEIDYLKDKKKEEQQQEEKKTEVIPPSREKKILEFEEPEPQAETIDNQSLKNEEKSKNDEKTSTVNDDDKSPNQENIETVDSKESETSKEQLEEKGKQVDQEATVNEKVEEKPEELEKSESEERDLKIKYKKAVLLAYKEKFTDLNKINIPIVMSTSRPGNRSEGSSARKSRNPNPHLDAPLHKSENKWTPGQAADEVENFKKKVVFILNKVTPTNLAKLTNKLIEYLESSEMDITRLKVFVKSVFDKALFDTHYAGNYAHICKRINEEVKSLKVIKDEEGVELSFKKELLNQCQVEFEEGKNDIDPSGKTPEEIEELRLKQKSRMLGNIRFIGELYKAELLIGKIVFFCFNHLLRNIENPDEADIECLCKLFESIGRNVDFDGKIDHYMQKLDSFGKNKILPSRLRFQCLDVIDLRKNKWVPRMKKTEAKTIEEIRREHEFNKNPRQRPLNSRQGSLLFKRNDRYGKSKLLKMKQKKQNGNAAPTTTITRVSMKRAVSDPTPTEEDLENKYHEEAEKFLKDIKTAAKEYIQNKNIKETMEYWDDHKDLPQPLWYKSVEALILTISEVPGKVDNMIELINHFFDNKKLEMGDVLKGLNSIAQKLSDWVYDSPKTIDEIGLFTGKLIATNKLDLKSVFQLEDLKDNEGSIKIYKSILQTLKEIPDRDYQNDVKVLEEIGDEFCQDLLK